jgi:hypothetical protein
MTPTNRWKLISVVLAGCMSYSWWHTDARSAPKPAAQRMKGPLRVSAAALGVSVDELIRQLFAAKDVETVRATGDRTFNPGWNLSLDLRNLLVISQAVARSALERRESRGGHTRTDHPATDKGEWSKVNVVVRRTAKGMEVTKEPLPAWPDEMRAIIEEKVPTPGGEEKS